jgi:hypothetical protein
MHKTLISGIYFALYLICCPHYPLYLLVSFLFLLCSLSIFVPAMMCFFSFYPMQDIVWLVKTLKNIIPSRTNQDSWKICTLLMRGTFHIMYIIGLQVYQCYSGVLHKRLRAQFF